MEPTDNQQIIIHQLNELKAQINELKTQIKELEDKKCPLWAVGLIGFVVGCLTQVLIKFIR